MNSVNLIGRMVRDPEQVAVRSDVMLVTFSIAVDDGKDETSFYDCKAFGKTAELVLTWKHKGDQVGVSGRLKQERWEKDGSKRSAVRIIADRVTFIGSKGDSQLQGESPAKDEYVKKAAEVLDAVPADDDDIPF